MSKAKLSKIDVYRNNGMTLFFSITYYYARMIH